MCCVCRRGSVDLHADPFGGDQEARRDELPPTRFSRHASQAAILARLGRGHQQTFSRHEVEARMNEFPYLFSFSTIDCYPPTYIHTLTSKKSSLNKNQNLFEKILTNKSDL